MVDDGCYGDAQETENICITFVQRRANVEDVGSTLYKCYINVLYLLGSAWLQLHMQMVFIISRTLYKVLDIIH